LERRLYLGKIFFFQSGVTMQKESNRMSEKTLLLILGFFLTTIIGGFWGYFLKKHSWRLETEHSLFSARYDEGITFLDLLSEQVGKRFFLLQRYLWAIEEGKVEKTIERENQYFATVIEWNSCFWRNRNKIRLLVNENQANLFLNYQDDNAGDHPKSLHYKFVVAHRAVQNAKTNHDLCTIANRQVEELNWMCSVFLERLTTEFLQRAQGLQLLQAPTEPGAAEQAAPEDTL
jgi:hypothetical protein